MILPIQAWPLSDTASFQLRDIPAECSNPPFGSCTFYADCLESLYHCGPSGYPIGYGQYYCEAFLAAESTFSAQGQVWLINTMQCLQAALVPEATGEDNTTCTALGNKALGTHAACYVDNGLCSLPATDWLEIVSIVGLAELLENWNEISSVAGGCAALWGWIFPSTTTSTTSIPASTPNPMPGPSPGCAACSAIYPGESCCLLNPDSLAPTCVCGSFGDCSQFGSSSDAVFCPNAQ